ncbi:hypothetical protein JCM9533A_61890 [Catenuloplanes niger JCM 9533]
MWHRPGSDGFAAAVAADTSGTADADPDASAVPAAPPPHPASNSAGAAAETIATRTRKLLMVFCVPVRGAHETRRNRQKATPAVSAASAVYAASSSHWIDQYRSYG